MNTLDASPAVRVWDLPTRVFHWSLAALVALAWITGEAGGEGLVFAIHRLAGYAVLVALLFRLAWGFVGSEHARFRAFVHPWRAVREYAGGVAAMRPRRTVGHNPLGGWMVVALLAALALTVGTGLFAADDGVGGPLAAMVSARAAHAVAEVHEALTGVILGLIAAHVAGVLAHSLLAGENLVRAMLTGRKRAHEVPPGTVGIAPTPAWRAALALGAAAAVAWLVVTT